MHPYLQRQQASPHACKAFGKPRLTLNHERSLGQAGGQVRSRGGVDRAGLLFHQFIRLGFAGHTAGHQNGSMAPCLPTE